MQNHFLWAGLLGTLPFAQPTPSQLCRRIPSDHEWPSPADWDALNTTLSGRLIRTDPIGHVCHDPTYDADACRYVQDNWDNVEWRTSLADNLLSPAFAGDSCDPFAPRAMPCTVGGNVLYNVNVTTPADVARGIEFARRRNIRLVVKNTGHDFLGRSVGYGGLGLWMHNVQGMDLIPHYKTHDYSGPAIKLMAGTQSYQAYEFVNRHGYMIAGGECATVGIAGGFTSGGGHGPASSYLGLAADQTLEFEVILANGTLLRAARDGETEDLYWALSGGGPGFGVVWSVTYKLFRDVPVVGNVISFKAGNRTEAYWQAIDTWNSLITAIADVQGFAYTNIGPDEFSITPVFVPNSNRQEMETLLSPLHRRLEELGIPYDSNTTEFRGFYDAWRALLPQKGAGYGINHLTTRLLPRRVFTQDLQNFASVARSIVDEGGYLLEMVVSPRHASPVSSGGRGRSDTAVNAAWQSSDMLFYAISGRENSTQADVDDQVTYAWGDRLRALAPESGSYMNEADPDEPDFRRAFHGEKYPRLLGVKRRYDPEGFFMRRLLWGVRSGWRGGMGGFVGLGR
ncbi:hypothetical protein M409DRAFT_55550 [Zasmidium cellare ATCC 36951]|uniref:FAD-binding PCMH-type domain-containing protein n=1 Tax=Zasmidium cellare ATCC 36951 TaxID=1080233 RepID=A0A6A6CF22_ZASCE|nr:uncharacterized protein M409DRAFT_55550 [Zasmidium cellare ATCC 36951]KAF2165661.1 hypothetical protein M409DRAFT_55550 [Zasmidium cellare ATCC 36951]